MNLAPWGAAGDVIDPHEQKKTVIVAAAPAAALVFLGKRRETDSTAIEPRVTHGSRSGRSRRAR